MSDIADALAGAQGDGGIAGDGLGPALQQDGSLPSDGTPQNSPGAGLVGGAGGPGLAPMVVLAPVGGVLLNKPVLAGFEIHELALVGDELLLIVRDPLQRDLSQFTLERTVTDSLMVAAKSLLLGDHVWLSIDPPARFRDRICRGQLPPDGTPMVVSYGGCRGTAMGKCLLLCDLLLKHWTSGYDNETHQPVRTNVPGFRTLISMLHPGETQAGAWQRFWFVVETVSLFISESGSILDSQIRIKTLTETENDGGEQDPVAINFTNHINRYFDDYYAKLYPELAELKVCALATGAALWLLQNGKLDAPTVFSYKPYSVSTPESTPGIIVEGPNQFVEATSWGTSSRKIMLFGGVAVDPKLEILRDRRPDLSRIAAAARRHDERIWRFCDGNSDFVAAAMPLANR